MHQATDRVAPSYFDSLWADAVFWDGRAGPEFKDPLTGQLMMRRGGALENQVLGPLLNPVEMANEGRSWSDLTTKLQQVVPLALARDIPADMQTALESSADYPSLFARAFGDPGITATRIAFAIATYERTLVADRTPWDLASAARNVDSAPWRYGFMWFDHHKCTACHVPPLFTNNAFSNSGVRPAYLDRGRALETGLDADAGDMKVPSLRNVSLRSRFMHTGTFATLDDVLDLYAEPKAPPDPLPTTGEQYLVRMTDHTRSLVKDFLQSALTDPRVASETFPFDRPKLRSERQQDDSRAPEAPRDVTVDRRENEVTLRWAAANRRYGNSGLRD